MRPHKDFNQNVASGYKKIATVNLNNAKKSTDVINYLCTVMQLSIYILYTA